MVASCVWVLTRWYFGDEQLSADEQEAVRRFHKEVMFLRHYGAGEKKIKQLVCGVDINAGSMWRTDEEGRR